MLSRDFVRAFLLGQVQAGVSDTDAKNNFVAWISDPANSVCTEQEKQAAISDIDSYSTR